MRNIFRTLLLSLLLLPVTARAQYSVGNLKGEFGVSPLGGATYTVPIETPPGPGGSAPQIVLSYNSQGGNGPVGVGFGLSGTSVITRSGRDIHHDGYSQGLKFDSSDAICLDGTRLVLTNGTMWANGSTYVPENDPFMTITLLREALQAEPYFRVTTSDGTTLTYRYQPLQTQSGQQAVPVTWHLEHAEDRLGNYTDYSYTTHQNSVYLSGISYGGNTRAGTPSTGSMSFIYQSRSDIETSWVGNVRMRQEKRLSEIRTYSGSSLYRKYSLTYDSPVSGTTYHSRLQRVTENNGQNQSLAPLKFGWQGSLSSQESAVRMFSDDRSITVTGTPFDHFVRDNGTPYYISADMNGDGISDMVAIHPVRVSTNINNTAISTNYAFIYQGRVSSDGSISFTYLSTSAPFDIGTNINIGRCRELQGGVSSMDFDGDGNQELLIPYFNTGNGPSYFQPFIQSQTVPRLTCGLPVSGSSAMPCYMVSDLNGDGFSDIIVLDNLGISSNVSPSSPQTCNGAVIWGSNVAVPTSTGTAMGEVSNFTLIVSAVPRRIFVSDMNSDGSPDLTLVGDSYVQTYLGMGGQPACVTGETVPGFPFSITPHSSQAIASHNLSEMLDLNGDGLPDIATYKEHDGTITVYCGNADGSFTQVQSFDTDTDDHDYTNRDNGQRQFMAIDIDHDGLQDLLLAKPYFDSHHDISGYWGTYTATRFMVYRSNGSGLTLTADRYAHLSNWENMRSVLVGDFDGDGYVDIMYNGNAVQPLQLHGMHNMNSLADIREDEERLSYPLTISYKDSLSSEELRILMAEESGNPVQLTAIPSSDWHLLSCRADASEGRITSMTDSYGASTTVSYSYLTDGSIYSRTISSGSSYQPTFPVCTLQPALSVVSSASVAVNGQGQQNMGYSYRQLDLHRQGLGVLGFARTTVSNSTHGTVATTDVMGRESVHYTPTGMKVTQTVGSRSGWTASMQKTLAIREHTNGAYSSLLLSENSTDLDGVTTATSYSYDSDAAGNLRHLSPISVTASWPGTGLGKATTSTYASIGGIWLPKTVTVTATHPDGSGSFSETTHYGYDPQTALPDTVISRYGTDGEVMTLTTHDLWGNVTSERTVADGIPQVTQYTVYSQDGRFPLRTYSSPSLYETEYTYDTFGNLLTETDCSNSSNRLTTNYTYDGWGRPVNIAYPDGTHETTQLTFGPSGSTYLYEVTTAGSGSPAVTSRYDRYGRLRSESTTGPASKPVSRTYSYNSRGQVTSELTHDGDLELYTTSTYDPRGRLTYTASGSPYAPSHTASYSYGTRTDGNRHYTTVTETVDGITTTKSYDEWGLIRESADAYSKAVYRYGPHGQPTQITVSAAGSTPGDGQATVTTLTYDGFGRRTGMSDPDGGTTSTQYDLLDRVVWHQDARGNITETTYDTFGRTATITETAAADGSSAGSSSTASTTTTYTYGTSGGALGQVTQAVMADSDGSTADRKLTYAYDSYGRVITERRLIGTSTIGTVVRYQYDSSGRRNNITYGSVKLYRSFDNNGYLDRIDYSFNSIIDVTELWRRVSDTGHTSTSSVGGGLLTKTLEYSDEGQLSGIGYSRTRYDGSTARYQSFGYTYHDGTSFLSGRSGMSAAGTEAFTYDQAGRLTSSGTAAGQQTVTYSADGNILSRPQGIGTYSYQDNDHPHAVTGVTNPNGLVDAGIRQEISYTPFGKASLILQIREYAPDGTPLARPDTISSRRIIYGPDHQRWQTVLTDSTGVATTISYAPGCDVVQRGSVKTTSYYLEADGALVAIVKATSTYSDLFLAETDHLGSITGLVNESGTEFYTAEFDAWGQRTVTHAGTAVITPGFLPTSSSVSNYMPLRGYTGHEHYMECGLIDMNGRMYDPLTARFLSPDPYVQMPDNPQNFNRYAYCLNNPLMYTDPSGEIIWEAVLIGAAVGGTINLISNWNNCDGFWQFAAAFGAGAASGALTAATGGAGALVGISAAALGGAITSSTNNLIQQTGKNFSGEIDWGQVGRNSLAGGASAMVSYGCSAFATNFGSGQTQLGNSYIIKSPVVSFGVYGALAGATGGYLSGYASGYILSRGDTEYARHCAVSSAFFGASTGVTNGVVKGFSYSKKNHINPWNGKDSYFKDTHYSNKVKDQMLQGEYHSFPDIVENFEANGVKSTKIGGDGMYYQWLEIDGSYRGHDGTFEFIKDKDGIINHRFFRRK